jgi:hypothetical protein
MSSSSSSKVSAEVVKQLGLSTTPHPQPYNIGDKIFVSASSVDFHMTSIPSRMRYYVMLPHWMSVMFSWAIHICGSAMLFMSLDPVVSLLLWGGHLYRIPDIVPTTFPPKQYRKVVSHTTKSASSQYVRKVNIRILQPLQSQTKHLLSNRSRSTRLQQSTKIPSVHSHLKYPNWFNRLNPTSNRFVTTFHKSNIAMSLARQAAREDSDSANASLSPPGTQCNGDHCFLRR